MTIVSDALSAGIAVEQPAPEQPAWLNALDYPFESRFQVLDGNRVHYIDEGSGPPLLFLHANPLWSFQYRRIIGTLRATHRCVALDYPGFGLSSARAGFANTLPGNSQLVGQFVESLGLDGVTLVAHDVSVSIGLGAVTRDLQRFRALVLSNGFAWPISDDPEIARFIKIVASPVVGALIERFNLLCRYTATNLKLTPSETRAYLAPFAERTRRHHQYDFFRSIVRDRAYLQNLKESLHRVRHLPVLLAFADSDPTFKAGWMQRYEAIFPQHTSVRIEGSHHFPQEYNPDAIAHAIQTWWKGMVA